MDVVMLPLVSRETAVGAALDLLRHRERSGLVVDEHGDDYRLLYTGDLLRARAREIRTVGEVPYGEPVVFLGDLHRQRYAVDVDRPLQTPMQYEEMFKTLGKDYGLARQPRERTRPDGGMVTIVTLHEGQSALLMATGGYQCTGTTPHYFPRPQVRAGDECPNAPCKDKDGNDSTIRPAY